MVQRPSPAAALYPHLPRQSDEPSKQQRPQDLASSMYPKLSREARAADARAAEREAEWVKYMALVGFRKIRRSK